MIPEGSESTWVVTQVSPRGDEVRLGFEGTNLERFRVRTDTLKFVDRKPPARTSNPFTSAESVFDAAQALERVRIVQSENLHRLDDDIAILTKFLKKEGASKSVLETLEALSNEQHASWQTAFERMERLMEEE
ncbi:hypothetical protein [Tunturiibacter lichenicola]|uniref:hypothetical protein n=1 Tax=Tunturiibacter lichenicola TaxID=2051959 RepID=UPI0021B3E497|nr:hypothetical protein [Edaphobacter lichenicola]